MSTSRRLPTPLTRIFLTLPCSGEAAEETSLQQPPLTRQRDRLGTVVGAELVEDRGQVEFHRALADREAAGNLLVRQTLGHQPEHGALTLGELAAGSTRRADLGHQPSRHPRLQ